MSLHGNNEESLKNFRMQSEGPFSHREFSQKIKKYISIEDEFKTHLKNIQREKKIINFNLFMRLILF